MSVDGALYFLTYNFQTVKVQGNDISHKLQISKVRKKDEGLYECRVTDASYGELQEHKAQAYLKVNTNSHARRMQAFEASPMWLQDAKPRKNASAAAPSSVHSSASQQTHATSSPHAVARIPKQSPQSGMEARFEPSGVSRTAPLQGGHLESGRRPQETWADKGAGVRPSTLESLTQAGPAVGGCPFIPAGLQIQRTCELASFSPVCTRYRKNKSCNVVTLEMHIRFPYRFMYQ